MIEAMAHPLPKILCVVGPTASGKTALALELAREFDGEIVNADSRQVYRGMDIATAKVNSQEIKKSRNQKINHKLTPDKGFHCFDLVNPDEAFSLSDYQHAANAAIADILSRGKLPIVVGGTGLYIRALVENLQMPEVPADLVLRNELESYSIAELYSELLKIDPKTAGVIDRNNKRRLVRALEVVKKTGKSFMELGAKGPAKYQVLILGLNPPREILKKRVEMRIDEQIKYGLLDEAKSLLAKYDASLPSMSGIGYPEAAEYLAGNISLDEMRTKLVANTMHYARRQMTFFKKLPVKWLEDVSVASSIVSAFLK